MIKAEDNFIRAYHDFRDSVDFDKRGFLPDLEDLVLCIVMGIPAVPADEMAVQEENDTAVDQRVTILKAVFVEVNREESDEFLDMGLSRYDQAGSLAKTFLKDVVRSAD
jgi:hypothetical protein